MSTPAIIYIRILAASFGITLANHGKPKTGNTSIWQWLFGAGLVVGLLYWGGFFS